MRKQSKVWWWIEHGSPNNEETGKWQGQIQESSHAGAKQTGMARQDSRNAKGSLNRTSYLQHHLGRTSGYLQPHP